MTQPAGTSDMAAAPETTTSTSNAAPLFGRPRPRRVTVTYTRKNAPRNKERSVALRVPEKDDTELEEQLAKRVKCKKPDFSVAKDEHAVDLEAFANMSMKSSINPTLKEKTNTFEPLSSNSVKKPNHLKEPPKPALTSSPSHKPATPPRVSKYSQQSTLHSTPGVVNPSAFTFQLPDLDALGLPAIPSTSLSDYMNNTIRIESGEIPSPDSSPSTSDSNTMLIITKTKANHNAPNPVKPMLHDDVDEALASLMKESTTLNGTDNRVRKSSSSSLLPKPPLSRNTESKPSSEAEGFASDEMGGNKHPLTSNAPSRAKSLRKKKASTRVISTGSLKVKKKKSSDGSSASPTAGGFQGSSGRKRSSTSSLDKLTTVAETSGEKRAMKGSVIRDVAIKADSSGSGDEIGL